MTKAAHAIRKKQNPKKKTLKTGRSNIDGYLFLFLVLLYITSTIVNYRGSIYPAVYVHTGYGLFATFLYQAAWIAAGFCFKTRLALKISAIFWSSCLVLALFSILLSLDIIFPLDGLVSILMLVFYLLPFSGYAVLPFDTYIPMQILIAALCVLFFIQLRKWRPKVKQRTSYIEEKESFLAPVILYLTLEGAALLTVILYFLDPYAEII